MYENVCYESNYIKEVICRFDFAMPTRSFEKAMPKQVFTAVRRSFPISEPNEVVGTEFQIHPVRGAVINNVVTKQWTFWSRDKRSSCVIVPDAVVFTFHVYTRFEDLEASVSDILHSIMQYDEAIQGKRFGLRYVNVLDLNGHEDWIDQKSYGALASHRTSQTTRLETTSEYAVVDKDLNVRLIYGFSNPDYPAVMKRDWFTIDIDAYVQSIIYEDDVDEMLAVMHEEAQSCFEGMITDACRDKLGRHE